MPAAGTGRRSGRARSSSSPWVSVAVPVLCAVVGMWIGYQLRAVHTGNDASAAAAASDCDCSAEVEAAVARAAAAGAEAEAPRVLPRAVAASAGADRGVARVKATKITRWSDVQDLIDVYPQLPPIDAYPIKDKFSLIMMTYQRPQHVMWQLQRMIKCPSLHRIYLIFNDQVGKTWDTASMEGRLKSYIKSDAVGGRITPIFPKANVMNNRFVPENFPGLETDIIMWLDDDMEVQVKEVERAFRLSARYPLQPVGFFPRAVASKGDTFEYVIPHHLTGHTEYSMILPGGGTFANVRLLHLFAHTLDKRVFNFVWDNNDCDDIAFNMATSNFTRLSPVYVLSTTKTTRDVKETTSFKGMRASKNHGSMRVTCLRKFIKEFFKYNPLVPTDMMLAPYTFNKPTLVKLLEMTGHNPDLLWHWRK